MNEIDRCGEFNITADQIKAFREPRLMAKFDHRLSLPKIFTDNNVNIIPVSRGSYRLGRFKLYEEIAPITEPVEIHSFDSPFETLDFNNISSEVMAISCAYVSQILSIFLGEEITPTVAGRMNSGQFDFELDGVQGKNHKISVSNAQIEIDAGFESLSSFVLVEAKNYLADDFNIRQLYFPFRKWQGLITKPVRNLFLNYSNGIFELREYQFSARDRLNSIELIGQSKFSVADSHISTEILQKILSETRPESSPETIPFPQADRFERVINLCELIFNSAMITKSDITENYGFVSRQTDYYLNAAKYLDLIENRQDIVLTKATELIFSRSLQSRQRYFIAQILKRRVFHEALSLSLGQAEKLTRQQIVEIMKRDPGVTVNPVTLERRASTIRAWTDWILSQIEE